MNAHQTESISVGSMVALAEKRYRLPGPDGDGDLTGAEVLALAALLERDGNPGNDPALAFAHAPKAYRYRYAFGSSLASKVETVKRWHQEDGARAYR